MYDVLHELMVFGGGIIVTLVGAALFDDDRVRPNISALRCMLGGPLMIGGFVISANTFWHSGWPILFLVPIYCLLASALSR